MRAIIAEQCFLEKEWPESIAMQYPIRACTLTCRAGQILVGGTGIEPVTPAV